LRANREYSHLKINRFVADFISFKVEQPYDMVISFQVFEHLAEPEKYLAFCVDACCKGGVVGICTPNRLRFDNRLLIRNGQPPVLVDVMHFREYTAKEIYRMGRQFGLKPSGWFGHTLYLSSSWASSWSAKWNYRQRTQMGYLFPHIAHVMCVLLRKG
jgi:SAM-dependent methyltransferase